MTIIVQKLIDYSILRGLPQPKDIGYKIELSILELELLRQILWNVSQGVSVSDKKKILFADTAQVIINKALVANGD